MEHPITVFYVYADTDEELRQQLEKHLALLQRQGVLANWQESLAGALWKQEREQYFNKASLILLLVSADFLASDVCYQEQMQRALEREKQGEVQVLPILVRPVDVTNAPFTHLPMVPTNGLAVTLWANQDAAWAHITEGIRCVLEDKPLPVVQESKKEARHAAGNQQAVYGQTIGEHNEIHQHYYLPVSPPPVLAVAPVKPIWMVPYPRNPFFTGRAELLVQLATALHSGHLTALSQPQGISGLGGVGKTQLVVEYAYRHVRDYEAVLWIPAENYETLHAGFASIADLLSLPERYESDQQKRVQAVKQWLLQQSHWLLILDNADDLSLLLDFLPLGKSKGHILLTTRAYALGGLANRIEVDTLDQAAGTLLLLHRAGLLPLEMSLEQARDDDRFDGQQIWHELGGLPLALDQAGAYIEETQCGLSNYLHLFQTHRSVLLKQRGGVLRDHPDSVHTTFTLAVRAAAQHHVAVEDLLRVCTFLHPDTIPEEIFLQGADHLSSTLEATCTDPQEWNVLLRTVSAYSLFKRQPREKALSIHRLMQAVLQEYMSEQERVQWAYGVITALNHVFPKNSNASWKTCERLVSHILSLEKQTHSWTNVPLELADLLQRTAGQIVRRMQYKQAEPLYQRALQILERALGFDHLDVASLLERLATLSYFQGKYTQSELLHQRVLSMKEKMLGFNHPEVASWLNVFAFFYLKQGKDEQAEALYQQALQIFELQESDLVVMPLINLGELYYSQGKKEEAEILQKQALDIWEKTTHAGTFLGVIILSNLSYISCDRGDYEQAEHFSQRALHLCEQDPGPERADMVTPLRSLAYLYEKRGQYQQAGLLYQRALSIYDQGTKVGHEEHPDIVDMLQAMADLYQKQGIDEQAEPLYRRVLHYNEQVFGFQHLKTTEIRKRYDELLQTMGQMQGSSVNGDNIV